jgi:hypothetical protein
VRVAELLKTDESQNMSINLDLDDEALASFPLVP